MHTNSRHLLSPAVVVGAKGVMGQFFCRCLSESGIEVLEVDISTDMQLRDQTLKKASLVVVSVPISVTCSVIDELLVKIAQDCLLVDLTSVKELPLASMRKHKGEFIGMHPMFAPSDRGFAGETVVICQEKQGPKSEILINWLRKSGACLEFLSASRHDQLMAVVQGLNHFHSIVFAHTFSQLSIGVEDTISVASPVYKLRMQFMGRILAQNPSLYAEMLLFNPYVAEALSYLMSSTDRFLSCIRSGSREKCVEFFIEAADQFGSYRDKALSESNLLLELVKNR